MKFWAAIVISSLSFSVQADTITRDQSDAVVQGIRAATTGLLESCQESDDFESCAEANGIRCENISEKSAKDYRCETRATIEFASDGSTPAAISAVWGVTFRAFYLDDLWHFGPERIGSVID